MVASTNSKPPPKDPKIISSSVRWGTESQSREVVRVSALQGYCRDPQRNTGRNPFARAKQAPTLLIMIIINYKDRAELPQPEPLPRKTSFSLDEKSLGCLPQRNRGESRVEPSTDHHPPPLCHSSRAITGPLKAKFISTAETNCP